MNEKVLQELMLAAADWFDAFKRCQIGQNERIDEFGRHVTSAPNVPAIVIGCFSCELYLRYLAKNDDFTKQHQLIEFFSKLDDNLKESIIAEYKRRTEDDFYEQLGLINKSFNEWRYYYKKKAQLTRLNLNLRFLHIILPILDSMVNNDKNQK